MSFLISPSPRVRRSPFFESTVADGVVSFSPYNRMLMPTGYGDPEAEYWRLINGVSMWDVSVERQIEVRGKDAARLAQILTPRKLGSLRVGVGWYVAICDHRGTIINDPILLKLAEDRYWFSIADSDLLLWARAVASERELDVDIIEADVSPLAVQGPRAEDVVVSLLGEEYRSIRKFHFKPAQIDGIPLMVARSGWSHQGGYELYLMDGSRGNDLWQRVKSAGEPYGIGPGNPNPCERIESGLLSWGGDTDDLTNPFEVRMGRYVDLDAPDDVVGIQALRRISSEGVKRHQLGVIMDMSGETDYMDKPGEILVDDSGVGSLTAKVWSRRLQKNIGLCLVDRSVCAGDCVSVRLPGGQVVAGNMTSLPFLPPGPVS